LPWSNFSTPFFKRTGIRLKNQNTITGFYLKQRMMFKGLNADHKFNEEESSFHQHLQVVHRRLLGDEGGGGGGQQQQEQQQQQHQQQPHQQQQEHQQQQQQPQQQHHPEEQLQQQQQQAISNHNCWFLVRCDQRYDKETVAAAMIPYL
jgi:hypothetical protein